MGSKVENVSVIASARPPRVFETRAAPKGISLEANTLKLSLVLDHGFRIYSEQVLTLSGVVINPDTTKLLESFVNNWLAHSCKPSTLWVSSLDEHLANVDRDALDDWGKPCGATHSLAADLVEQGLATWVEGNEDA